MQSYLTIINTTTLLLCVFPYFYNLDTPTILLLRPHFHGQRVFVVTGFHCSSNLGNVVTSSPIDVVRFLFLFKEFITYYSIAVPSRPPTSFSLTASSSTSIRASWQLPPADSQNGIITGFKLFYKKKDSAGTPVALHINNGTTYIGDVTGLDKYTEYEFQVLAFTSVGDGPKSSAMVKRTLQDGKRSEIISCFQYIVVFKLLRL